MSVINFLPQQDAALLAWLTNFSVVAKANLTELKLTLADVQPVTTDATQFQTKLSAAVAAKDAAKIATHSRVLARNKAVKDARALVKRIQGTPGVSDETKMALRITVSSGRRPEVPVYQPTSPSATVQADLNVLVKWHKNGNFYGTGYVIERQLGAGAAWTTIEKVTATRFVDTTLTPGVNATYRITATRGHLASAPSAEASLYPKAARVNLKAA